MRYQPAASDAAFSIPAAGEIHVWSLPIDMPPDSVALLTALLSEDERARAVRFKFEKDRRRFISARGALRVLLGRYLHMYPEEICFDYGPNGKPSLRGASGLERLHFNASHSGAFALIALCQGEELGIDIEFVREIDDAANIVRRFFCPNEVEQWLRLPAELRNRGFFECWTRKEAYVKAVGAGLSLPLDEFEVSFSPGDPPAIRVSDGCAARQWSMFDISPAPGYAAALAIHGPGWVLRCWMGVDLLACRSPRTPRPTCTVSLDR